LAGNGCVVSRQRGLVVAVAGRGDATARARGITVGMSNGANGTAGPSVDIVIVNWNSRQLLRECVSALDRSSIVESLGVIIIDNASTDGSADGLSARHVRLDLVRNAENRGFAAACNQGAARGSAPFVLFLNPDVVVGADTVESTARFL